MLDHPTPEPDLSAAIGFLRDLRPNGPWNLTAIVPDGPIISATFTDPDKARAWIARHADRANIHFTANAAPSPTGRGGRVRKGDLPLIEWLHGDHDVDKLSDGHELAGLSLPQRKSAVEADIDLFGLSPTLLVDSGGGLQGLWRLAEPLPGTPENIELAESMNRWLALRFAGGEPQCADVAHLLRLPGTLNFPDAKKRQRGRTVVAAKLVSSTGQVHDRSAFGQVAAPAKATTDISIGAPEECDLADLITSHRLPDRLVTVVREGELPGQSKDGDNSRSGWLFDGVCNLLRHGVVPEQVLWLLLDPELGISASVLDPAKNPTPERQLAYAERQVRNALALIAGERQADADLMAKQPDEGGPAGSVPGLSFHRASDITIRPLNPLWPGRIYRGKLTTLAGMPEQGKSMVTCDICARVSRGAEWPDGSGRAPLGTAIMLASEDDPADTIVPRLMAAGADLDKVLIIGSLVTGEKGGKRMLNIADDLHRLDDLVRQFPDTRVLIVDPVNSYMGTSKENDSFRDSDVRAVLGPLKEWGERHQIAVAIVIHFKKGGSGRALDQVMGSIAFTALARSAWAFIEEKDEDGRATGRKLMARIKQNITAPVDALAYRLVGIDVAPGINAPRAEWDGVVLGAADDVLIGGQTKGAKKPSKADAAAIFLIGRLSEGPASAAEIQAAAREAGYSDKTIRTAKDRVGVESFKAATGWFWRLAETEVPEC